MLGEFSEQVYLDLLDKHNVPIASITYFFPDDWLKKIQYFRCYQHIIHLRDAIETKNVRVHAEFAPVLSECLADRYASRINDYLIYYLYDDEVMFNRNYQVFLSNFKQFDVELKGECRSVKNSNDFSHNMLTTYLNVYKFYQDLVEKVEIDEKVGSSSETKKTPKQSMRESVTSNKVPPSQKTHGYISSKVGSTVFEECNFLKIELATNGEVSCDASGIELLFLRKTANYIESCEKTNYFKRIAPADDFFYYKPLTEVSLAQRFQATLEDCYFVERLYCPQNWQLLIFERKHNQLSYQTKYHHLNTKVCFRDFARFVFNENPVLIKERLRSYTGVEDLTLEIKKLFEITLDQFIRSKSLKYNLPHTNDVKSTTDHSDQKQSKVSVKTIPEAEIIEGFNLSDTYVQVTESNTRFSTSNGSLNMVLNSWLYSFKELEVNLKVLGNQFLFNRIFNQERNKETKIITCNKIVISVDFVNHKPKVNIIMPNGHILRNLEFQKEPKRKFLELKHTKNISFEHKRIYISDGSLISFLVNRKAAMIVRHNGLIMKTPVTLLKCKPDEIDQESTKLANSEVDEECEEECFERSPYKFELEWMKKISCLFDIDGSSFSLRPSTGQTFEVHCGQITETNHTFAQTNFRDYSEGKIVICGEQGLSMSWSCFHGLTTNYQYNNYQNVTIKSDIMDLEPLIDSDLGEYFFKNHLA